VKKIMPMPNETVSMLQAAWDRELDKSRPFWINIPEFPFPYNRDAPSIAYDPAAIPAEAVGAFCHLKYSPPPEANNLAVTREHIEAGKPRGDLCHEFGNVLIEHPNRPDLIVIPNRWPRVSYHSLIVSRDLLPQKMLSEMARAELYWADLAFVVEFHRFSRILDHFHFHIYPGSCSPIYQARNSFFLTRDLINLRVGHLKSYPVPHIALNSANVEVLVSSIEQISALLDDLKIPYGQILMKCSDESYVFLIFIREGPYFDGLSFSLIGLIRSSKSISEPEMLEFVNAIHRSGKALAQTEAALSAVLG
jgi:hypothetical protein